MKARSDIIGHEWSGHLNELFSRVTRLGKLHYGSNLECGECLADRLELWLIRSTVCFIVANSGDIEVESMNSPDDSLCIWS